MTTAIHVRDDKYDQIESDDLVELILPGRNIFPLGKAILTFKQHKPIIVEILRTSNCQIRNIPFMDISLCGLHGPEDVLLDIRAAMKDYSPLGDEIDMNEEVTVIRFRKSVLN